MKTYILGLFVLLTLSSSICDDLKYVAVVVRHGARAPQTSIPVFNIISDWPMGFEEITPSGQRMLYLFGKHLREKYITKEKFLPENYDPSKISFRSSYYHRTTSSAQSLAAGLYQTGLERLTNEQFSNENIWVPPQNLHINEIIKKELNYSGLPFDLPSIPVLNYDASKDREIVFASCKAYNHYRQSFYNTSKYEQIMEKYLPKFQETCALLGASCTDLKGYMNFLYADYILAAEFDNQWPRLSARKDLVDHMERFYTDLMVGELMANEIQHKISMYGFGELMIPLLENAQKSPEKALKMSIIETHDSTILQWLISLGFPKENLFDKIAYASNMIFELRENAGNKELYINLIYNDQVLIDKMPLEKFIESIKDKGKLDKDINEVCKVPKPDNSEIMVIQENSGVSTFLWILAGIVCASIIGKIIYGLTKKQQKRAQNEENYNGIQDVVIINH